MSEIALPSPSQISHKSFSFIKTLYYSINLEIFEKTLLPTPLELSGTYLKLKLPLHRSYRRAAAIAVPSLRMRWLGLSCLLVPWLAAAALMALGAHQLHYSKQ